MAFQSPDNLRNTATQRPPEKWGTYKLVLAKTRLVKGEKIVVLDVQHEDGAQFSWFLHTSNRSTAICVAKLAEYEGLSWPDGADEDAVADIFNKNLGSFDLKVKYGDGDKVFVNDVAKAGEGGTDEEREEKRAEEPKSTEKPRQRSDW